MSFFNGFAKFYAYLFHFALSSVLIGIAILAKTGHESLRLDMLPFEQARLISRISLMALIGFLCIFLALARIFEIVFPLWSFALLVLIVWGFFFTPYSFHGPVGLSGTLGIVFASFFAFYGSLMNLMPQRRNRW